MNNLKLIKQENFGTVACDFWKNENNEICMTIGQLADALEYSSKDALASLLSRNSYLTGSEFSGTCRLQASDGKFYNTRIFTEDGIYEVTMLSNQPKAKQFRAWFREQQKTIGDRNKEKNDQLPAVRESQEAQVFENNEFGEIRTVIVEGNPWFVGKDIAEILGYANPRKALADHVDERDKGVTNRYTLGGNQEMTIISESGLYSLIFSSKLPSAKKFTYWVTSEVLPSIRKHGMYVTEELLDNPEFAAKVFMTLHEERQQRIAAEQRVGVLEEKIELDKPLVNFATAVSASNESIPVGDFAKLLKQNGVDIGRNRMLEWFRNNGYLIKAGASKNLPTQRYMNSGLFEIHESGYYDNGGNWQIILTTFITGKGQKYFFDKFFASMSA